MTEAENNKQIDGDTLQRKGDVFRAHDIIPGVPKRSKAHSGNHHPYGEKTEIPKFDLAEEIMAEQRKITAIKRKAPGQEIGTKGQKPKLEPIDYTIERPEPVPSEQDQIIAEIVARDIERLYRDATQ